MHAETDALQSADRDANGIYADEVEPGGGMLF
jgi:hypothetical protein